MITLHLEAESLEELRGLVLKALGKMPLADFVKEREQGTLDGDIAKDVVTKRRHRATNPTPVGPTVPAKDEDKPDVAAGAFTGPVEEPIDEEPVDEAEALNGTALKSNPVLDEKLKKEIIDQLAQLFTAGKVKVVRHVLEKYGRGAKSFPEIDAVHFHEIRDAIAKGETA